MRRDGVARCQVGQQCGRLGHGSDMAQEMEQVMEQDVEQDMEQDMEQEV